jgi:hypothetical protein
MYFFAKRNYNFSKFDNYISRRRKRQTFAHVRRSLIKNFMFREKLRIDFFCKSSFKQILTSMYMGTDSKVERLKVEGRLLGH